MLAEGHTRRRMNGLDKGLSEDLISLFPMWLDRWVCGWWVNDQMNRRVGRWTDGWVGDWVDEDVVSESFEVSISFSETVNTKNPLHKETNKYQ